MRAAHRRLVPVTIGWLSLLVASGLGLGCMKPATKRIQQAKEAIYARDPQRALKEYRLAVDAAEHDESLEAYVLRARALRGAADTYYLELQDFSRAAEVYRELIQVCPNAPETVDARIHLADILSTHFHDLRGAIGELSAAIAQNAPDSADLTYRVAKLYFELADYEQSRLESQKVIRKFETSPYVDDAMFLLAQALGMEGRRPDSAQAFTDLIKRFPESELAPHALYELGRLSAEMDEEEKAIELWVQALKRHPNPKLVQASISRLRRRIATTTPLRIGDHALAFDHAARARARVRMRTSVEAVGGTAEEAARDRGD